MPQELAKQIRAKYPGVYDDLSDAELEAKILAKYPEYKDLATSVPGTPSIPEITQPQGPGLVSKAWGAATTPLVDIRGGPMMKEASEQFAKDYPVTGGIANFGADILSSMTSPLNLAFGGAGLAEATGARIGLPLVSKIGQVGRHALSAPLVAEGAYNVATGETLPEKFVGGLELGGGLLGMRGIRGGAKPKISIAEIPKRTFAKAETPTTIYKPPLPEGWTTEVGRTRTKEGHTAEAQVDWKNKKIIFSEERYLQNPEMMNHEIAHINVETMPREIQGKLFDDYIKLKENTPSWKEYGKDWIVKNHFHREEIAMDLGTYYTDPTKLDVATRTLFGKYFGRPETSGLGATTESLIAAIKASKPLNKEQAKIYTAERAEKFAKARTVDIKGEETANKFMGQLAGEHTKVIMEPLVPDDITLNSWYRIVGEHLKTNPEIDVPRAAQAIDAIKKMREGSVPVKSQIETLEKIFPGAREALAGRAPSETSMFRQGYDVSRSLMAIDPPFLTSAAFRQGAPYVGTKDWFKAWWTAAKSFKSQTLYEATMAKIDGMPLFKRTLNPTTRKFEPSYADKIGLRLSDMGAIRGREEIIRGSLVEKWPLIGRYVKANNRAYTAFLNDLRASRLNSIVKAAESNGLNPTKNLAWGKQAAEAINTLTGAGKLGIEIGPKQISVERSTKLLTDTLFAPRLIASRVRMLNPSTYIMANPMVRREYVKGLLRNVMAWWGIAELAEIGAGAIVSKDPSSADFGKIKIGNTRIDAGGGLQQYLVLGYRIPTALLGGKYTSSVSNKEYEYARGYKPETAFTTSMNFVINKLHPVLKLLVDIAAANENRPVNLADRVLQNYTPMISGDLLEVLREDPTLLPIVGLFGGTGMGAQTYEAGPQKSKIIPESWDLRIPSVR